MKRIKKLMLFIIGLLLIPNIVFAASGKMKLTGSNTAIVGNKVTVTLTISSSQKMVSWEAEIDYDKNMLKLVSSTAENGGTYMVNSSSGTKSKTYSFTFKALKSGNASVKVGSYYVIDDSLNPDGISMSITNKTIKIMTQDELEATYSSDATLKSLGIEGYDLTPEFNKNTYEYNLQVENNIETVKINATKNDVNATVQGDGEVTLTEGDNKFEIRVTAQKGNVQSYYITVNRKELDPIDFEVDGKTLRVVRKEADLTIPNNFVVKNIKINDLDVPSLYSEITDITIIGLKDSEGNINYYIYQDDKIDKKYIEYNSNQTNIIILPLKESKIFKNYLKVDNLDIDGIKMEAYKITAGSKQAIIYAQDTTTGLEDYYLYDIQNDTFMLYRGELDKYYQKQFNNYKYVILGLFILIVLLLLICIFKGKKKNKDKDKNIKECQTKEKEIDNIEEEKIIKETKKNKSKKQEKSKEEKAYNLETIVENNDNSQETIELTIDHLDEKSIKKQDRKLVKEQKKLLKEQKKQEKEDKKHKKDFDF